MNVDQPDHLSTIAAMTARRETTLLLARRMASDIRDICSARVFSSRKLTNLASSRYAGLVTHTPLVWYSRVGN